MYQTKPSYTPMLLALALDAHLDEPLYANPTFYRSIMGPLYTLLSHDLAFYMLLTRLVNL